MGPAREAKGRKPPGWLLATFVSLVVMAWVAGWIVELRDTAGPRAAAALGAPAVALVVLFLLLFRRRIRDGVKRLVREHVPPPPPRR